MNFLKNISNYLLLAIWVLVSSCATQKGFPEEGLKIAVIADVHLQDVYGKLQDSDYLGIKNPKNGEYVLIRTMGSQLRSTRIFNENYFAFLTALDDVVKRKVKYVLLPGDFSDDGQPLHIRGLKQILNHYSKNFGISFFMITGNHDVVQPFNHQDGKLDFMGKDGKSQPILSDSTLYVSDTNMTYPAIISSDIQNLGYLSITEMLGDFGFFPKKEHIYWESPFSKYNYDSYDFKNVENSASLEHRSYLIPSNDLPIPDVSYLVEPVEGLWLLAIDASTYIKKEKTTADNRISQDYLNTGIGLDNLLEHKKYLMDWVREVVQEANKYGKTLFAFSHYPMVDFTNGASDQIGNLLVGSQMQLKRVPNEEVVEMFADAGLKIHFGGHMHMNDTGVKTTSKGNTLVNIQVPSLAAYWPAYKLVTIKKEAIINVETVTVDSVPRFNEFFDLYEQEHAYLNSIGAENIWDKDILSSKNYHEFITLHLKELVRLRFLNSEWPSEFVTFLLNISGQELLALSKSNGSETLEELLKKIKMDVNKTSNLWSKAHESLNETHLVFDRFGDWSGHDLIFDLYRLRSADQLAFKDIGSERLLQYQFIIDSFLKKGNSNPNKDPMRRDLLGLMQIFQKFMNGEPSDYFQINLKTGKVSPLHNKSMD